MERSLDLEVTRRCNLRCDYCFVGWSRDWHSDLPRAIAEEVIREGAGRFDLLHITGGEPFVYKPVFDLIELGLSLGYPAVVVNSNGTMLSDAQIARLGSYGERVAISISLDGPAPIHDEVRGAGRFAQSDATMAKLIAAGVPTTVMSVVTPTVLQVLLPFLRERMTAHPGLTGITLFPVGVGPSGSQKPGASIASLTPEDMHLLAAQVALAWRAGIPVTVSTYPMINPLLRALGYPPEQMYYCTAGRGRIGVHADQSVSTCHPVKDPVYGRWSSGLFDRLDQFAAHRALGARDYDGCRGCSHKEECGHCRAFVTGNGAPLLGNDRVCLDVVPGRREELERQMADIPVPAPRADRAVLIRPQSLVRRAKETDGAALVHRFASVLANGRYEELDEIIAADCEDRNPLPLQVPGRPGIVYKLALWRALRPAARSEVTHVEVLPDGALAHWRTDPGGGEPVGTFLGRFTTAAGRITAFEVTHVG